jgi:hypothetical protein
MNSIHSIMQCSQMVRYRQVTLHHQHVSAVTAKLEQSAKCAKSLVVAELIAISIDSCNLVVQLYNIITVKNRS